MKAPTTDDDYSPAHAAEINRLLAEATTKTAADISAEHKLKCVQSLAEVLHGAVVILHKRLNGAPEPYPGAATEVRRQARVAHELATRSGLLS